MHARSASNLKPLYIEVKQAALLLASVVDYRMLCTGAIAMLSVIVGGALAALAPLVLKSLVDAVAAARQVATNGWSSLGTYTASYLMIVLAGRLLADARPLLSGTINQTLHGRLTQRFFDHVLGLPMGYLLRRRGGEMLQALNLGTAGFQLIVIHLIGSLLPAFVELATMTTVLSRLGLPLLVVVFATSALAYVIIFTVGARRTRRMANDVSSHSLEAHAQVSEGISHVETLRYFSAEDQASSRLRDANLALERCWSRLNRLNLATTLAASAIFAASMAACIAISARAVIENAISVGGFVLITAYMLQMARPLESLGTAAKDLSRALGYMRPLLELLAEPLSLDSAGSRDPSRSATTIRRRAMSLKLENLHFGYHLDRPVLRGVDLEVPAGNTMAIVGRSGSGKSSLARLLMRLYTPDEGRILLDGESIESMDIAELRALVGLVPQETALLHATIAENVALGSPRASRDDIRIAVRDAQLETFVDTLPLGLDTPVGERGMQLSGGERQRVGIARVLLRRPALYVLDEPTSMLDSKTEFEIQKTLRCLPADATIVIMAHRLSTVAEADEIVVLDDGRIQERGTHAALLARNGLYAQMWRQQTAGDA